MTTPESLPSGIYRIAVGLGVEPALLTRQGDNVTILPPSAQRDPEQEWEVIPANDGNVVIQKPSRIFPSTYLTYNGAPEKPKQGDRVVDRVFEFPPNEWHFGIAPGFHYFLRVAGSDLGIALSPLTIFPPFLELAVENQLIWRFERIEE